MYIAGKKEDMYIETTKSPAWEFVRLRKAFVVCMKKERFRCGSTTTNDEQIFLVSI